MKYSLFISDFDGTLVREDGTISERSKLTIARYMQAGGKFAVCTGRATKSITPRVRELGISDGLVVSFQGGVITDIATGEYLRNEGFEEADALYILRALEARGLHIQAYTADEFYCNERDELLPYYEKVCGIRAVIQPNLDDLIINRHEKIIKYLLMLEPQKRAALFKELEKELGEKYYVTSSAAWLIEIMPKTVNKGEGVRFLANYFQIPLEKVAAIGDQMNDLPMMEVAGGKFAPENAEEELKKLAIVVSSNEEDGVAEAIEKYAMGE